MKSMTRSNCAYAAEINKYTARFGGGMGSGVRMPWLSFIKKMCEGFIPDRASVFVTSRDPPVS
jgi:hypothetical protein